MSDIDWAPSMAGRNRLEELKHIAGHGLPYALCSPFLKEWWMTSACDKLTKPSPVCMYMHFSTQIVSLPGRGYDAKSVPTQLSG